MCIGYRRIDPVVYVPNGLRYIPKIYIECVPMRVEIVGNFYIFIFLFFLSLSCTTHTYIHAAQLYFCQLQFHHAVVCLLCFSSIRLCVCVRGWLDDTTNIHRRIIECTKTVIYNNAIQRCGGGCTRKCFKIHINPI